MNFKWNKSCSLIFLCMEDSLHLCFSRLSMASQLLFSLYLYSWVIVWSNFGTIKNSYTSTTNRSLPSANTHNRNNHQRCTQFIPCFKWALRNHQETRRSASLAKNRDKKRRIIFKHYKKTWSNSPKKYRTRTLKYQLAKIP